MNTNKDYSAPYRSHQLICRPMGWRPMVTAPTDGTRVMLRCLDGATMGHHSAHRSVSIGHWDKHEVFGVLSPDWYCDADYLLEPDGWLPLPDVNESQPIKIKDPPISLFDFVKKDLNAIGAPVPWHLLKFAPVTIEDATELAFLLDVDVQFIQNIDRNHRSWMAEFGNC